MSIKNAINKLVNFVRFFYDKIEYYPSKNYWNDILTYQTTNFQYNFPPRKKFFYSYSNQIDEFCSK